ncbi:hybrid sensor histidine kinase/response regulator [Pseudoflavitalea rhizosphaerae]|uniref:ATP-binding response regulator n=1 Tax=Pseudoflavitalea rhizosphaerae TaxID=1884793 RepID=UPI000F8D9DE4|nr:ATP-binding protein [Pseudoflavitalea rhizosphaerae]
MLTSLINPVISFFNKVRMAFGNSWRWWLRVCSSGSSHIIDEQEKERYTKINQFGILMTVILSFFIPVFHYFALPKPDFRITIGIAVYAALNFIAWRLNRKWQKPLHAAWLLYLTTCVAIGYFGLMMGHYINLQFMVFFMLAIAFQIFPNGKSRYLAIGLAVLVLAVLQWGYLNFPPFVYLDPIADATYIKVIHLLAMYSVLVVVLLTSWTYVVSKDKSHKLQKSNRHIKTYMAHVTHEVRSPINAIGLLTKRMHREIMNNPRYAELEAYAQMLNMASLNAQQVISNVLTLSEIEAGKPEPIIIETFNVKQFFTKLISVSSVLGQKKQIRINLLFDQVPSLISSDPHKISHIVNNLLSNAIKFGNRKSTVTITVNCDERNGKWTIDVKNQGKPIPPEKMNSLYDPFVRGLNGTLVPESSGLGLFITRNKVNALGGEIIADCKDGFTIFTVTLPMQLGKLREVDNKEEEEMIQTNFKGARVVVAEDDALNARALSISLETLGCRVEIAENGKELLERAQSMPDLIIMDYHMPLMNGETAIRLLKGNEHLRTIPVVVTTGDVFTDSLDKLMAAGAEDFILKPIESLPLAKVLSRYLGAARIFSINPPQENINLG